MSTSDESGLKIVVLGIGNVLLTDEGVGVHATQFLERSGRLTGVTFIDGGTMSFAISAAIEEADALIVFDAARLPNGEDGPSDPGDIGVFEGDEMDSFLTSSRKGSVHEVGLVDLLACALLSGRLPQRRALIGIEPELVEWGEHPTEAVARAIPIACDYAVDLVAGWRP